MVAEFTKNQKERIRDIEYNKQFNELFKLHKYLVECPLTNHSIGQGNQVDDAIELIDLLINKEKNI